MMIEKDASTIGELLDATREIASAWRPNVSDPQELWFRGQPKREFRLLPGLYRPNMRRYHFHEPTLLGHFKSLAAPYVNLRPADDWEWCFLAQHYGLPTRLLDWTQSLLAAAYFAVCDSILCRDRLAVDSALEQGRLDPVFDNDSPVVWVLDAGTLNRRSCAEDIVLYPGGPLTAAFLPDELESARSEANELPLALFAPRTNVRIAAQQGTFTIHGHSDRSLEEIASDSYPKAPIELACVRLDRANLAFIWEELQLLGVGRLALFPDLESVATHVKWLLQSLR